MTTRECSAGFGGTLVSPVVAMRSSSSSSIAPSTAYSSSQMRTLVPSRSETSLICRAAKSVLRRIRRAPTFEAPNAASKKPRWLRIRIATPSPAPTPRECSSLATAFVRASSSL